MANFNFRWMAGLGLWLAAWLLAGPGWSQTPAPAPGQAQAPAQAQVQTESTDVVILMDRSGSMKKNDQRGLSRSLAFYLVDQAELAAEGNRIAVAPFATDVTPLGSGLSIDPSALRLGLQGLPEPNGQTDIEMALRTAARLLAPLDDGRRKQIILLTDGMPEPNPADKDRFPEIADKFNRKVAGLTPNSREYRNILEEYSKLAVEQSIQNIQNVILPALEGKVEIYPIGLHSTQTHQDFLKTLAVRTTRIPESLTLVSNANELVLAAQRLVHTDSRRVPIVQERVANPDTAFSKDIVFGPYFSQARVVVSFLDAGVKAEDLDISLTAPSGETLGRESREYLSARDRDGSGDLVFERFMLNQLGAGTWRLELKSRRNTKRLPSFELLVEGRSNLRLSVEANPYQVQVPGPVEIRAALSSADGHPVAIDRATGEVRDRQGNALPLIFKGDSGGLAVGRVELPAQPVGDYLVTVRAYVAEGENFAISGRTSFLAMPLEPVEISVTIPYGGAGATGGDSLKEDRLSFPLVGDQVLDATIKGISVENRSARAAPISMELRALTHNVSGEVIDGGAWFRLQPPQGTATLDRPFRFDLTLRVPKPLPGSLPNGLYSGTLRILSPDIPLPLEVPLEVTLGVPDIEVADPAVARDGLQLSLWWRRPGSVGEELGVRTNSAAPQKARVKLISHVMDSTGGAVDPARLHLAPFKGFSEQVEIPTDTLVTLPVGAVAEIAGVAPGIYRGEIFIDGERARDLRVPVSISVPSLQGIEIARWLALGLALIALSLGAWLIMLRLRRRGLLVNDTWEIDGRRDFRDGSYVFSPARRPLFMINQEGDRDDEDLTYRLSAAGGGMVEVTDAGEPVDLPCELVEGYDVAAGGFRLRMQRLSAQRLRGRVLASPYSRHGLASVLALCAALLLSILWAWWTLA